MPPGGVAFMGTWHESTYTFGGPTFNATFQFQGSAIEVYCILAPLDPPVATDTYMTFFIDDESVGNLIISPAQVGQYTQTLVYTNTSLSADIEHTFVLQNGSPEATSNGTLAIFDKLIYWHDDGSSPKKHTHTPIIVGVVIAVVVVLALLIVGIYWWRRRWLSPADSDSVDVAAEPFTASTPSTAVDRWTAMSSKYNFAAASFRRHPVRTMSSGSAGPDQTLATTVPRSLSTPMPSVDVPTEPPDSPPPYRRHASVRKPSDSCFSAVISFKMSKPEEDVNPYELLDVTMASTEQEIKTAYRQRSLKVHPDRNRGNPDAARKFHELNQAYELLLDPLRRIALDAKVRLKEATKARFAKFDNKRKDLINDLDERERAFKKAKLDQEGKQKEVWRENEKIMEEGRLMRERRAQELLAREQEAEKKTEERSELDPPSIGTLDTTVRLKYTLCAYPALTTPESVSALLSSFGAVDTGDILVSLKPAPPKKPKRGIALVPFKQIGDAFAVVCASGREERRLKDIEVSWAEGKEPDLIAWLKKLGKLGSGGQEKNTASAEATSETTPSNTPAESSGTPFSSFPSTFPDISESAFALPNTSVPGLDFETLTLMRMRQAERERIEREIREQEADEGS
ncbi:hypothetical protein EUX98_g7652 [Antrodiella citrinella]|uniref:J domain-containing protein n=1 Tax=Antrodiella citrinella TaxID=2447956 RepID=A0A4S4ML07_9APHY|nr:hypothetical protein EUX98_g7652 [Antrodiella citrinella]